MKRLLMIPAFGLVVLTLAATFPGHKNTSITHVSAMDTPVAPGPDSPKPLDKFVLNGLDWLAEAQLPGGGWGAGQHNFQQIRDPHAVQADPATTAFAAMALLCAGSTLENGPYAKQLNKALDALLLMVDNAPPGNNITSITGTQPQRKLGQNIDVSMTAQFLMRIRPMVGVDKKKLDAIDKALSVCLDKLEQGQNTDGSYADGGWAPVLQSAMATNALEQADAAGFSVSPGKLQNAKAYQRSNIDATSGSVAAGSAAGVSLYALASTQRASAQDAARVREVLKDEAHILKEISGEDLSRKLSKRGVSREEAEVLSEAFVVNRSAQQQLQDDKVLSGFGNNGGEEFLSYMMTSESLASAGDKEWDQWHAKMQNMLSSVQNPDGSWSGHHCITSPVFCTAAVILTMTADREKI